MDDIESVFKLLDRHKDIIIKMNIRLFTYQAISDKLKSRGVEVTQYTIKHWCEMNKINRKTLYDYKREHSM